MNADPVALLVSTAGSVANSPQVSVGRGQRLRDNVFPALLFTVATTVRGVSLLTSLQSSPSEPGVGAWSSFVLDLAHQSLSCLFLALISLLFLTRGTPQSGRARPLQFLIALLGTTVMTVALLQPATLQDWKVLLAADLLLTLGLGFTIYAALSLRRCFSIAPEARGLVVTGAYRLVRHPMYLGEFVASLGAILPVLGPFTLLIFVLFCVLQSGRAAMEERTLQAAFPEYEAYRLRTPAVLPWPR